MKYKKIAMPSLVIFILVIIAGCVEINIPSQESIDSPDNNDLGFFSDEPQDDLRVSEKLVGIWVTAFKNLDANTMVQMSDTPYYMSNEILMTTEDIKEEYQNLFSEADPQEIEEIQNIKITGIKSMKISELKNVGVDRDQEKMLSRLTVSDSDIVVIMTSKTENNYETEITFLFRRYNNYVKMIGVTG